MFSDEFSEYPPTYFLLNQDRTLRALKKNKSVQLRYCSAVNPENPEATLPDILPVSVGVTKQHDPE